jgi:hypothetical protein
VKDIVVENILQNPAKIDEKVPVPVPAQSPEKEKARPPKDEL